MTDKKRKRAIKAIRKYLQTPKGRFTAAKANAKYKRKQWDIDLETYFNLIHCPCSYCNESSQGYGVGLDRIDNNKGYLIGNVVPCCGLCNRIKANSYTQDQMKKIGYLIREIKSII